MDNYNKEKEKINNQERDIKITTNPNLQNKKESFQKTQKRINTFFTILLYLMIILFLAFIVYHLLNNQITITFIHNNDFLLTKESNDDYNVIPSNNEYKGKKRLLNFEFADETFTQETVFNTTNTFFKPEIMSKFNNFTKTCYDGKLINKKKYPLLKNPKISVTIPIYNGGKYLNYSLRSIQNQKMKEIEIILIDDNSQDNTLEIIEQFMKEDKRIRLIKNIKNRKILYSKSMGALNANGKYILQLDQDDMYIREDLFDLLYNEAEKEQLELIQIRDLIYRHFYLTNSTTINTPEKHLIFHEKTHIKSQQELKDTLFDGKTNYLLWGALIKTDNYKKAIYQLWPVIINYQITFQEDYMVSFYLVLVTKKYKYINNFGLIHLSHSCATSQGFYANSKFYLNIFFLANNIYDYYIKDNPQDIRILFNYVLTYKYWLDVGQSLYPKYRNFILKKIYDNKYLSEEQKNYLKENFNDIQTSEIYQIWKTYEYMPDSINEYKQIYDFHNSKIKNEKREINLQPVISIIIVCSEFKYLEKTIDSIQNQDFLYFEIILIYDSDDENKDLESIKKYIKPYVNIILIDNKEKRGLIYSYSNGILSSSGQYILILEPSDDLAKENSLNELAQVIKNNNKFDILEFNLLINKDEFIKEKSLILYKCKHMESEIDLSAIKYNQNYKEIDQEKELLNNKLIKAELFKKIIEKYYFNNMERKIYNYYDNIFLYALQNNNKTKFKRVENNVVIKNILNYNELNIKNIMEDKNQKIKDSIFYINFLYETSNNTVKGKEYALNEFYNILSVIYNKFSRISRESYNLFKKFINSKYIPKLDKINLQFYCSSLVN